MESEESERSSLFQKMYKSRRARLFYSVIIIIIGFVANSKSTEMTSYLIIGGIIGMLSSVSFSILELYFNFD
jgi:hypothetical protein